MSRGAELTINADYARLIQPFISTEETRYYLNGFWVQPHPHKGAFIVATDGVTLAVFHDEFGSVTIPGIVRLSKSTLSTCKPSKKETRRVLVVEADTVCVYRNWDEEQGRGVLVASEEGVVIDGDYLDWRKVIPPVPTKFAMASFDGRLLARFAKLALGISPVRVYSASDADPAIVLIGRDDFLGVMMPMRADVRFPSWLPASPVAESSAAAAE